VRAGVLVDEECVSHIGPTNGSGVRGQRQGESFPDARPTGGMDPLEALAGDLRERLLAGAGDGDADLPGRIRSLVDREAGVLSEDRRVELAARIAQRAFGLGPLEPLLADAAVDEIMVSGTAPVWVERHGRLEATGVRFEREGDLRDAIERILAPLGRRADEAEPLCDARLPDWTACT
jgi:pilus assembly protein CpaF